MIRHGDPARDAARCAELYAPAIEGAGYASFEATAPTDAEVALRIASANETHAWLVDEADGTVTGYAYAGPHHAREGYRWAANVAAYVDPAYQGRGIGRGLYDALLGLLERQGLRWAMALIALPNPASVALHEACGFTRVGRFAAIGYKAGAWRDVGLWQRELARLGAGEPPEPLGPQRL